MGLLRWALAFFVIAIIAAVFGFGNIAAGAADIARILFFVFVAICVILFILGMTVYRTVSEFAGTAVELRYTVETVDEPSRFVIVGRNASTTSHDTITVSPRPERGSTVVYRAELTFTGVTKLAGPIMRPMLDRLGDRTAEQLKSALDRL